MVEGRKKNGRLRLSGNRWKKCEKHDNYYLWGPSPIQSLERLGRTVSLSFLPIISLFAHFTGFLPIYTTHRGGHRSTLLHDKISIVLYSTHYCNHIIRKCKMWG